MHNGLTKHASAAPSTPKLPDPGASPRPLEHYVRIVKANAGKIALASLVLTTVVVVLCSFFPKINKASAAIAVDRQTRPESIGDNLMLTTGDDQFMATQLTLIQEDNVLRPVAEKFHLLEREHQLTRFFFWKYSPERERSIREAPTTLKKLKVSREPNTYVLTISYKDKDPAVAAAVANSIANSYLERIVEMRAKEAGRLTDSMEQQLLDLKRKMEASDAALLRYEKELGTADPDQKTSILVAKLQALNAEYTAAEGDRIGKQSILRSEKHGQLPSSQDQNLDKELQAVNAARANLSVAAATYGERHPEYQKARALMVDAEKTLDVDRQKMMQRAEVDYRQAAYQEQMLDNAVASTKQEVDDLTARSFEYKRLKNEADANQTVYADLFAKIKQAGINSELDNAVIRLADQARPPAKPIFPNWVLIVPACLVFFTLAAIAYFIWCDVTDDSAKDPLRVEQALGVSVICSLPEIADGQHLLPGPGLQTLSSGSQPPALETGFFFERVRQLRRYISSSPETLGARTLLVTSALPGEGKSTIAFALAMAQAEQGMRTLLIDADLRQSTLEKMARLERQPGLSDFLSGGQPVDHYFRHVPGAGELFLLGSGTSLPLPLALLGGKIRNILDAASEHFDSIILDSPPMLGCAETLDLAVATDTTLITARSGRTEMSSLRAVVTSLQRLDVRIAGLVLNEATGVDDKVYKLYRRYYQTAPSA
jgi:polysaccharide biosynthesis transport protein